MEKAVEKFEGLGHQKSDIKGRLLQVKFAQKDICIIYVAIGVTNQRETTILWDKQTGKVLHNALVWLDARTQETVDFLLKQYNKRQDCLQVCLIFSNISMQKSFHPQEQCGLPISTYFSALKIRWLIDNKEEVRKSIEAKRCMFGTVDSWLLYVISREFCFKHDFCYYFHDQNLLSNDGNIVHVTDVTNASRKKKTRPIF